MFRVFYILNRTHYILESFSHKVIVFSFKFYIRINIFVVIIPQFLYLSKSSEHLNIELKPRLVEIPMKINILMTDYVLKSGDNYYLYYCTPRYILNEFCDEKDDLKIDKTVTEVIDAISQSLGYEKSDLRKALYIEGTMAMCRNVESGADISEKDEFLKTIHSLEKYL